MKFKSSKKAPIIDDYGYIGDCHSSALVSKYGSIDWCCMPRIDASPCFARLLDWDGGGFCQIFPKYRCHITRNYVPGTMILETHFCSLKSNAKVKLLDFFPMRSGGKHHPYQQIIRIVEGVRGKMRLKAIVAPSFDYGAIKPWISVYKRTAYIAIGGSEGLLISGNIPLSLQELNHLEASFSIEADQRLYLSIVYQKPEQLEEALMEVPSIEELDWRLTQTENWWHAWMAQGKVAGPYANLLERSALVLKALSNAPTGAIAAAPTTSLPEALKGNRNWDYRFSWIRDAYFSVRALSALGFIKEADGFRRFIERSSHSSAGGLQTLFGVGGETRLHEFIIHELRGFRNNGPVRIGNAAVNQLQLDMYGELVDLAYNRHQSGASPSEDDWSFLVQIINNVLTAWQKPDCGIWEMRHESRHFVHSKVMCWLALDRGIKLAEALNKTVPLTEWEETREAIRSAVEKKGFDMERGVFIQAFDYPIMDASLLLLPLLGFVHFKDERMMRTVDAIYEDLNENGLIRRYPVGTDGLEGQEGVFIACSFWLTICYALQNRMEMAHKVFQQAIATANELDLFSEEYDPQRKMMLGNFPQGLTHLSLIAAGVVLHQIEQTTHG
ncbi:MAG: glycoside hydrolase family 15 protein [Gammaproteobacteria bacterium]